MNRWNIHSRESVTHRAFKFSRYRCSDPPSNFHGTLRNRVVDVPPNKRSAYVVTQFDTLAPADRSCDGETNKSVMHVREISTAWIYTVSVVYRVSVPWRRAALENI